MASSSDHPASSDNNNLNQPVVLPAKANSHSHPSDLSALVTSSSSLDDSKKSWSPSFNRRESWDEQNMKHHLHHWLLQTEKGKESGFTEIKP
ncbi:hypothetical protein V8E54_012722 [Elaphomyces granulatus]|jgi:hypothetical protein